MSYVIEMRKIIGRTVIRTQGHWVRSALATSVQCSPLFLSISSFTIHQALFLSLFLLTSFSLHNSLTVRLFISLSLVSFNLIYSFVFWFTMLLLHLSPAGRSLSPTFRLPDQDPPSWLRDPINGKIGEMYDHPLFDYAAVYRWTKQHYRFAQQSQVFCEDLLCWWSQWLIDFLLQKQRHLEWKLTTLSALPSSYFDLSVC